LNDEFLVLNFFSSVVNNIRVYSCVFVVQAWVEIHRDELFADWQLALAGEEPFRISPLQ
jgi:hypothetical protein